MMVPARILPSSKSARLVLILFLAGILGPTTFADTPKTPRDNPLPPALEKPAPENLEDLRAIQEQVKKVLEKARPCTVGVRAGSAQGSGVIVSADGYVLTAGHVSGQPDRDVTLVLSDGRKVKAKTLGANRGIDSGLIKITEAGTWPFAEMGNSAELKKGQWCITMGHPGGYKADRQPVVRLGRVLESSDSLIRTDCTLVGGDSGGPLFDMAGKVIGIHSRIGGPITANIHVPVDTYRETWDRLVKGENWGGRLGGSAANTPYLGLTVEQDARDCKISEITTGSPAEKAGLKKDDVIVKFDGRKIDTFEDLGAQIRRKKPGDEVAVEVQRDREVVALKLVLGKRPS